MDTERFVDVGYCLPYCGHQVLEKVKQGVISHERNKVYFNSEDDLNQYCLPLDSIEFVVPTVDEEKLEEYWKEREEERKREEIAKHVANGDSMPCLHISDGFFDVKGFATSANYFDMSNHPSIKYSEVYNEDGTEK
jgi:hypothetical protein